MKKYLFFLLLIATTALPSLADADFEFKYDAETLTCSLSKVSNLSGDVVIPAKVESNGKEYTVVTIKSFVFDNCDIISLTIPESITKIEARGLSSIHTRTLFYNARQCEMEDTSYIAVDNLIIGKGVKTIPEIAYWPKTLEFWQGVESIGVVGTEMYIVHLTDIDEWAMNAPSGFNPVGIKKGSPSPGKPFNYYHESKEIKADYNGNPITNITLGSKVTKIAPYAFAGFEDVRSVTFSDYLTEIGIIAIFAFK